MGWSAAIRNKRRRGNPTSTHTHRVVRNRKITKNRCSRQFRVTVEHLDSVSFGIVLWPFAKTTPLGWDTIASIISYRLIDTPLSMLAVFFSLANVADAARWIVVSFYFCFSKFTYIVLLISFKSLFLFFIHAQITQAQKLPHIYDSHTCLRAFVYTIGI